MFLFQILPAQVIVVIVSLLLCSPGLLPAEGQPGRLDPEAEERTLR